MYYARMIRYNRKILIIIDIGNFGVNDISTFEKDNLIL